MTLIICQSVTCKYNEVIEENGRDPEKWKGVCKLNMCTWKINKESGCPHCINYEFDMEAFDEAIDEAKKTLEEKRRVAKGNENNRGITKA